MSVKKFRPYIEGYPFNIITDHASLKWLMSKKDLNGRLARWSLKLQPYDFVIVHTKSSENAVSDTLSRINCNSISETNESLKLIRLETVDLDSSFFQDTEYISHVNRIKSNPSHFLNLQVIEGKIFIRIERRKFQNLTDISAGKLWIPERLIKDILQKEYDEPTSAHGGLRKTLDRVRRYYYWPGMAKIVYDYVTKCDVCKCMKASNRITKPPIGNISIVARPFQKLYIDLLGPYPRSSDGMTMIIIVLDQLTKFVLLKSISRSTASAVVNYLKKDVFDMYGVPEIIKSDNGVQFRSNEFQQLLQEFGASHETTALYSAQSNASELVNRSITCSVRSYLNTSNHRSWDHHLSEVADALRNAIHDSTKHSPHFLLFGFHKVTHGNTY